MAFRGNLMALSQKQYVEVLSVTNETSCHAGQPETMHWMQHLHYQPHPLPHDCPEAGARWSPDIQPYDRKRPIFPVMYSDEDKQVRLKAAHRECM